MRIDGVLHPIYRIPKPVHAALTNRYKVMARLDVTEIEFQFARVF